MMLENNKKMIQEIKDIIISSRQKVAYAKILYNLSKIPDSVC